MIKVHPRFSIIFNGELLDDKPRDEVLKQLTLLTNIPQAELLDGLFSVKPVIVTQTHQEQLAAQYEREYRRIGLSVIVEPYHVTHEYLLNAALSFSHYAPLDKQETAPNFVLGALDEQTPNEQVYITGQYLVLFEGQLRADFSKNEAIANICALTNASEQQVLEAVFSIVPVILHQTDNKAEALAYQGAYAKAGLANEVLMHTQLEGEALTHSGLLIREDKPAPLPRKAVQHFTYTLLVLGLLAVLGWGLIHATLDDLFKPPNEPALEVKLTNYQAKEAPLEIPVKKPQSAQPEKQQITKAQPKSEPKSNKKPEVKPVVDRSLKREPEAKHQILPPVEQLAEPSIQPSPQQPNIQGDYYLQLLSWFANYQQKQQQNRQLEGEIKLKVTITRGGKVKKVKVLKSSSRKLSKLVKKQAEAASPFPAVPTEIGGEDYRFELPLRYTLE